MYGAGHCTIELRIYKQRGMSVTLRDLRACKRVSNCSLGMRTNEQRGMPRTVATRELRACSPVKL